ncbi:hypothetical protein OH77DRAFT_621441 [Trametes cingulata]|nr:hypothetical protein OH77DRAFT_621441 [Trametes cingulata]
MRPRLRHFSEIRTDGAIPEQKMPVKRATRSTGRSRDSRRTDGLCGHILLDFRSAHVQRIEPRSEPEPCESRVALFHLGDIERTRAHTPSRNPRVTSPGGASPLARRPILPLPAVHMHNSGYPGSCPPCARRAKPDTAGHKWMRDGSTGSLAPPRRSFSIQINSSSVF